MCECDDTTCPVHERRVCSNVRLWAMVERAGGKRRFLMCRGRTKDAVGCGSFTIIQRIEEGQHGSD